MTSAQARPTFGTALGYTPVEFPKSGRHRTLTSPEGVKQSVTAHDAKEQADLEAAGFEFPEFTGDPGAGYGTNSRGNSLREYPLVLHGPKGKTVMANDPGHEESLASHGWRRKPYPADEAPATVTPQAVAAGAPVNNALVESITNDYMKLQNDYAGLQGDYAALQSAHAQVKAERDALQATMDSAGNVSKAKLQKELADLTAEHTQLKAIHEELLSTVTN